MARRYASFPRGKLIPGAAGKDGHVVLATFDGPDVGSVDATPEGEFRLQPGTGFSTRPSGHAARMCLKNHPQGDSNPCLQDENLIS